MASASTGLLTDVRYALRSLTRSPWLTLVAVATLAVGSGAATTTWAVVDSILLEPLPYPDADRVVAVWHAAPGATFPLDDGGLLASASMLATYRDENQVFESIGLWTPGVATVTGDGDPEEVTRIAVTTGVLEALGVPPLLGRWFGESDVGGVPQVVLSYGFWQRRFGGDSNIVGRMLALNAATAEIVGVMPPGFRVADVEAELLQGPMQFSAADLSSNSFSYYGVARLKPGMTTDDANADLARMIPIWQEAWAPVGADAHLYTEVWGITPTVRPLKQDVVGDVGTLLWLVMTVVGVLMLIACANVTNLMLIRGAARRHEVAIRAALGAGLGRLRRSALLESLAVALLGGLAGLAIAAAGLRALADMGPTTLPRLPEVALDFDVVIAAISLALLAGGLVGIVLAARVDGLALQTGLHGGGRTVSSGRGQQRVQRSLVVAQVALAVVVLVCAGLAIRSAEALRSVTPGFSGAEDVQTFRLSMRVGQVPDAVVVAQRHQQILDGLAALPGVTAVGLASSMPMDGFNVLGDAIEVEGRAREPIVRRFKGVAPGTFAAVGTPLLAGRDYTWTDLFEYRPVAMVSENLARELWGEPAAALGKRLRVTSTDAWREIVGVVADVREDGLRRPAPTVVYWPTLQGPAAFDVYRSVIVAVRSSRAGTAELNREIEQVVWGVDPNLPLTWVRTLGDIYDESLSRTTFAVVTLAVAASAALALGVIGLYGVLSYAVSLRRREIAIRLALGARQRDVRRRFVRQGVALSVVGITIGIAAAAAVARLMTTLLYGVAVVDPLTYTGVAAGLVAVAALASYVPARRASTVDPAESLAAE